MFRPYFAELSMPHSRRSPEGATLMPTAHHSASRRFVSSDATEWVTRNPMARSFVRSVCRVPRQLAADEDSRSRRRAHRAARGDAEKVGQKLGQQHRAARAQERLLERALK